MKRRLGTPSALLIKGTNTAALLMGLTLLTPDRVSRGTLETLSTNETRLADEKRSLKHSWLPEVKHLMMQRKLGEDRV